MAEPIYVLSFENLITIVQHRHFSAIECNKQGIFTAQMWNTLNEPIVNLVGVTRTFFFSRRNDTLYKSLYHGDVHVWCA